MDHAESRSAGALWRATKLYVALRLHAEDTGPREQHTPSAARLSAWPVGTAQDRPVTPKFGGWTTAAERAGAEGMAPLDPYLLGGFSTPATAISWRARVATANASQGGPGGHPLRHRPGYAEGRMSCEAYRGVVYRQSFR